MANSQPPVTPIGSLLEDVAKLGRALASVRSPQIRSAEARSHIKAVAMAWFKTYQHGATGHDHTRIDTIFQSLLTSSEKSPSTTKVRKELKALKSDLVLLQTAIVSAGGAKAATELAPSFGSIANPEMRQILLRRWDECVACLSAGAPLAATVMMGGMLESLLLARINREPNQAMVFTAKAAPKDRKTQQARPLKDWGLSDYIAVAHELKWISRAANDVSGVLREYRNYIHPQKELAIQATLSTQDARMFWSVVKELTVQLV